MTRGSSFDLTIPVTLGLILVVEFVVAWPPCYGGERDPFSYLSASWEHGRTLRLWKSLDTYEERFFALTPRALWLLAVDFGEQRF